MSTVYCYVGLPGSGKTRRAKRDWFENPPGEFLDDVFTKEMFVTHLKTGVSLFITDPSMCFPENRKALESLCKEHNYTVQYTFFENNVHKAFANVDRRADGRRITMSTLIHVYSKNYVIPDGVEILPIWTPQ